MFYNMSMSMNLNTITDKCLRAELIKTERDIFFIKAFVKKKHFLL